MLTSAVCAAAERAGGPARHVGVKGPRAGVNGMSGRPGWAGTAPRGWVNWGLSAWATILAGPVAMCSTVADGVRVAMSGWGGRVIVGVSGSAGSLQALRRAVVEARLREAELWSVLAWIPPGGENLNRRHPDGYLLGLWERNALDRLRVAWDEALGGVPADLTARMFVGRGYAGGVLVRCARESDLLLVGTGSRNPVRRALGGSVAGYCARRASCAVLTVPPPPLQAWVGRGMLARYLSRRKVVRELTRGCSAGAVR